MMNAPSLAVPARGSVSLPKERLFSFTFLRNLTTLYIFCFISTAIMLYVYGPVYLELHSPIYTKLHPAEFMGFFFLTYDFCKNTKIQTILLQRKGLILYGTMLVLLVAYTALFSDGAFFPLFETFGSPLMFTLLILELRNSQRIMLGRFFDVFLVINSCVGIFEVVTNKHMIPFGQWSEALGLYVYPHEWRATAFLTHPLAASYVTAMYVIVLILTDRYKNVAIRTALISLHCFSLMAFGSRAAMVLLGIFFVGYFVSQASYAVATSRIRKSFLLLLAFFVPTAVIGAVLAIGSGFADRFLERFVSDHGSATARTLGMNLLLDLNIKDLIFGPPVKVIVGLERQYGVIAIENAWLSLLTQHGIVGFSLLLIGLAAFCREIYRTVGTQAAIILGLYFTLCATSESLGSKNFTFGFLAIMMMTGPLRRPIFGDAPIPDLRRPSGSAKNVRGGTEAPALGPVVASPPVSA